MKVKWQSDTPKMELKVPSEIKIDGGGYPPYELPIASESVLGGVKIDGDTITITDDGVISAKEADLSGVATKAELATIEGKIPSEYLKNASVADNKLTITKSSGDTIEFSGGSGSSSSSIPVYSFTSGQELTDEEKGQLDIIKDNPKSVIVYIDNLKVDNIFFESNTISFSASGSGSVSANSTLRYYEALHGAFYIYPYQLVQYYNPTTNSTKIADNTKITKMRGCDFPVEEINSSGSYSRLNKDFIVDWIHNPNQYNVCIENSPVFYVDADKDSSSAYLYYLTASPIGLTLKTTSLVFSDTNKLDFTSKFNQYYTFADQNLLTDANWQNYISLGGQGSWTYTSSTDDGSLYNATELIIMWLYNNEYYCNYYKFDQGSGSTLGGNYQGYTFNAYDHLNGQITSSWYYNGSAINTSSMDIQSIYYKT